jgi:flagellar basal-body rod modification protein FlgD
MVAVSTTSTATGTTNTTANSGAKSVTDTYQTFLSLLTANIRNQDPLSPMDTTQWTSQLVQYNSVEQQLKTNSLLESLVNQSTLSSMGQGVMYLGSTVTANTDTTALNDGSANWNYNLGADAGKVTINVKDSTGKIVYTTSGSELGAGDHTFSWDGTQTSGVKATSGNYTLSVAAQSAAGSDLTSTISVSGKVTGVVDEDGATILKLGKTSVKLTDVKEVAAAS